MLALAFDLNVCFDLKRRQVEDVGLQDRLLDAAQRLLLVGSVGRAQEGGKQSDQSNQDEGVTFHGRILNYAPAPGTVIGEMGDVAPLKGCLRLKVFKYMVARDGVEPPTPAFSGLRSTT